MRSRVRKLVPRITVVAPFCALLAAPLVLSLIGVREHDVIALGIAYVLAMLGITLGYHRALAHKSMILLPGARFVMLALGAVAAQGPPSFWVAHHRAHHGDPDGPHDPHSPVPRVNALPSRRERLRAIFHAHIGWMFEDGGRYDARLSKDLREDAVVRTVERHYPLLVTLGLVLPAIVTLLVEPTFGAFCTSIYWSGLVRIGLGHQSTWMVNSVCHLWGYRNFETRDASRNNWLVAALTLGEGWHNNHHANPARARHGIRPWEPDVTYAVARFLEAMGWARGVRR